MFENDTASRSSKRLGTVAATALLVAFCVTTVRPATGQTANATVTGAVKDQAGQPIPGVQVTAVSAQTGERRVMVTDVAGRYTITDLVPGFYDLQAAKESFATTVIRRMELLVNAAVTQNFALQPPTAGQTTIELQAAGSAEVETTRASVQTVMVTREVDSLPNLDRSASSLSFNAPGTVVSGSGGTATIQVGNGASYQTGFILDGLPNQTGNQGNQYFLSSQDWVQEFAVLALQFPAEFGNASGGVINTVTRSGGNKVHGRLSGFYRNQGLNSNPSYYTAPTKAPFISSRIGGMVGGAIKKNKLFYFAGFENLHQYTVGVLNATALAGAFGATAQPVGTPASQIVPWLVYGNSLTEPTKTDTHLAMFKLDYRPTPKNHFTLRGNLEFDDLTNTNYVAQGAFGGTQTYGNSASVFRDPYGVMFAWARALSPTSLNDVRAGYFQNGRAGAVYDNYCNVAPVYPNSAPLQEPYNFVTTESLGGVTQWGNPTGYYAEVKYNPVVAGGDLVGLMCGGVQNMDGNVSVQDTVTLIRGAHNLKFGGSVRHEDLWSRSAENNGAGTYVMAGAAGPFDPTVAIPQNFTAAGFTAAQKLAPLSYTVIYNPPSLTSFHRRFSSAAGFIHDTWKVNGSFTISMGLRYDISNNNSTMATQSWPALAAAVPGSTGFIQPGFHKVNNDPLEIAPRVGLAWTPFRDKLHTVIRGGFGLFYSANDGASVGIYTTGNAWATYDYQFSANTATTNPYCINNPGCVGKVIPPQYELAVMEVLGAALTNYTLPQFPVSTSPCAATNSCTVTYGGHTYNIPALSIPYTPQGARVDLAPNYNVPSAAQTTIGIEHQFNNGLTLSADYVNHYGFHGLVVVNNNIALTGPGASQSYTFVNPAYTAGYLESSIATLEANDIQVKASWHDHRNDRFAVAYQYGKSDDNSYSNFAISAHSAQASNPFNLNYDYGPSNIDTRHNLVVNANIPLYFGVELSPIFTFSSGLPYSATTSLQTPGSASAPAGCQAYFNQCYPAGYSRDSLRGDSTFGLNARLSKTVKLHENATVMVLIEAFNIPSWRNRGTNFFTNVDVATGATAFGQPTNTSNTLRQVQLGARINF
jgi:hypothetical protein